jgi:hypothetical protein
VGGEGRALPGRSQGGTSSPQKNAYRVPGLRFTQRTKDMVYIGLENLLPFPLLRWPLPGLLFGMAEGSHMRNWLNGPRGDKVKGGVLGQT